MNKFVFIIVSALAIQIAISSKCNLYKCLDDKDAGDKCMVYNATTENVTISVKLCDDKTKTCKVSSQEGKCETRKVENLVYGDDCTADSECMGALTCTEKKCKGVELDKNCTADYLCPVGYYCDGTCKAQVKSGDACKSDYACPNDEGCLNEKCTKYFSKKVGEEVTNPLFCESTLAETVDNKKVCVEVLLKSTECGADDKCEYELKSGENVTTTFKQDCICKLVDADKRYCQVGHESSQGKEAVKLAKQVIENTKGLHTVLRGQKIDYDLKKKIAINGKYPMFDGASDCIIDGFLSMNYLKISAFGLLLLGLLF